MQSASERRDKVLSGSRKYFSFFQKTSKPFSASVVLLNRTPKSKQEERRISP
jgi:hypothetical protein